MLIWKQRKDKAKFQELKLLFILGSIIFGVLYIYLTAKNPIWEYHFIGAEILLLLLIGILIDKIFISKLFVAGGVIAFCLLYSFLMFPTSNHNPKAIGGNLVAEEEVVKKVDLESGNKEYVVFAYSPSIYTYEYSYLFKWIYNKDVHYRPELNPQDAELVFLLFPPDTDRVKKEDFINFRTPSKVYKTSQQWTLTDGTHIMKRLKVDEKVN